MTQLTRWMAGDVSKSQRMPASLVVVAALFLIGGISAVIEVIVSLTRDHLSINFGVLGLFIGFGLLRLSPGWRTCGLFLLWITMIGTPLLGMLMLASPGQLRLTVFGQQAGEAPMELGLLLLLVLFLLALWQYRVLTRRDVRALFMDP